MLTGLFLLAKKIPYQVYLLVGVVFSLWFYGHWQYNRGQDAKQVEWNAAIERGKKVVEALKAKSEQVRTVVETKVVTQTKIIREKGDVLVKEVPVYIPAGTADLPAGFRVLHDAAASSSIPDSSSITTSSPVSVATATETIIGNYTTCLVWREQVLGWQEWYQELAHSWPPD